MHDISIGSQVTWALPGSAIWALAAIVAVLLVAIFTLRSRRRPGMPLRGKPLLTRSETEFFHKLVAVVERIGGLHVCPQVSMGAVMDADRNLDPQERMALRNRFSSKIIDFVLIDRNAGVRLIIELDDPSHNGREEQDRMRDSMTAAAGIATLRIADGRRISAGNLSRRITDSLPVT